ncbi:MAG: hypothetical protein ABEN55_18060, partial [Bradymonadaceae bacterium]
EDTYRGGVSERYDSGTPRLSLGMLLLSGQLDSARATLHRVALAYECFGNTKWDANAYGTYRFCRRLTRNMPSESEVKQALETHRPGQSFEHKNVLYMYRTGKQKRQQVIAKFDKIEQKYPGLTEVFVKPAKRARKRHAQLRDEFSEIYDELDPISEKITTFYLKRNKAKHAWRRLGMSLRELKRMTVRHRKNRWDARKKKLLADDCEQTLLSMREKLRQSLKPTDEQGANRVR